jgi:hypothetical protein
MCTHVSDIGFPVDGTQSGRAVEVRAARTRVDAVREMMKENQDAKEQVVA